MHLQRNKLATIGATIVLVFALGGTFAPWLTAYNPNRMDLSQKLSPPSLAHPLGTDELGRDLLSRILFGARSSVLTGLTVAAIGVCIGGILGLGGAWLGGTVDHLVGAVVEVMLSIPGILLALAIVAALGPSAEKIALALGVSSIPTFARVVRASVLVVRRSAYIEAARAAGATDSAIILRHVLHNIMAPVMVLASYQMATAGLAIATLSFIGLGAQPPSPEWGSMLARARDFINVAPYYPICTGSPIILLVMGFNLLGDGLRESMDPLLPLRT